MLSYHVKLVMEKIKILLIDDHALIRDGICAMLKDEEEIEIVGEAKNGQQGIEKIMELQPHVAIMDIMMPVMDGLEAAKMITEKDLNTYVIFLSMEVTEKSIDEAIKAGASGYLPKDSKKEVLVEAIKAVNEGRTYFSKQISDVIFDKFYKKSIKGQKVQVSNNQITKREVEVLRLIATGLSNSQIAEELFISIRTVDAHRNHIMQKIDARSTADLVKYAIKNEIIDF